MRRTLRLLRASIAQIDANGWTARVGHTKKHDANGVDLTRWPCGCCRHPSVAATLQRYARTQLHSVLFTPLCKYELGQALLFGWPVSIIIYAAVVEVALEVIIKIVHSPVFHSF